MRMLFRWRAFLAPMGARRGKMKEAPCLKKYIGNYAWETGVLTPGSNEKPSKGALGFQVCKEDHHNLAIQHPVCRLELCACCAGAALVCRLWFARAAAK